MNKPDKTVGGAANLGEVTNKIYLLLKGLQSEDRGRVMNSVTQLFGDPSPASITSAQPRAFGTSVPSAPNVQSATTPQQYFATKAPQNKGEMLAVAAKYREDHGAGQFHSLQDFADFFVQARQNFDRKNFRRDMDNAQRTGHLFNKGTPKGQYQLSYYGQQYVDALPDHDAAKQLRRPSRKSSKAKKASASK